jgi:hypothetical protein
VAADPAYVDLIKKLGDDVRLKIGPELDKFWDDESEMVAQLYKELVAVDKDK